MENRLETNLKIYELLGDFILDHPDLRFNQILWILNIVNKEDRFYETPEETLRKVKDILYHAEEE